MKKYLLIFVAISIACSLCSCGSQKSDVVKLMDKYEACVEELCRNSDSAYDAIDALRDVVEMENAVFDLDTSKMSAEDLKYYNDVLKRTQNRMQSFVTHSD